MISARTAGFVVTNTDYPNTKVDFNQMAAKLRKEFPTFKTVDLGPVNLGVSLCALSTLQRFLAEHQYETCRIDANVPDFTALSPS